MPHPWTTTHELHIFKQALRRPSDDAQWWETQSSGLVHLLCNCGYSTGWIPQDQMPSREQLLNDHGTPHHSVMT
ncbi:hypothetical protein [Streptomyces acidiscabies]|uniref:Uncharacterized protein n=1 Tax=Streptomyces acidiscabies TaxID=42234 RepID=A0ABU4LMA3_9ACTN|nr:hypothetical protein [Streptomyces acidiscabies]MDX3016743.1 hypothetical protein [Streptomyces acidiscabies]